MITELYLVMLQHLYTKFVMRICDEHVDNVKVQVIFLQY